jgi:hypothetical protein
MMNIMKQFLLTIFAAVFAIAAMAQNDGSICDKAIYVDSTLVQRVAANTTLWFTANTEDLPLTVYFFPDEPMEYGPEVYIDFTCTPGVYEDENIRDIIDLAASVELYFPFGAVAGEVEIDGETVYMMSYERDLLELFLALGIDYSIPVYVSFRSSVAGTMQMSNIKTMTLCTDVCQRVEMRDTLYLQADKENLFYFPVTEWKDKNMSFAWTGTAPIRAYLETDCEFDTLTSEYTYDFATESNGMYTQLVSVNGINNYIRDAEDGNMYVTFVTSEDGQVYVADYVDHGSMTIVDCVDDFETEAISFPTSEGGVAMSAKASLPYRIESDKLKNKDVRLTWATTENKLAVAYFANFCGFELKAADPDVVDTIHFAYNEELQAMVADIPMERMNRIVNRNTDGWLFMQIYREEAGTFAWDTYENIQPDCDTKSLLLQPNDSVEMPADYYNTSYKLVAKDWIGYRHTFTWKSTCQAYIFIADSCSFPLAPYNVHVGKYMVVNPNDSVSMSVDDIEMLNKDFTDEYGNLYLRLRSTAPGALVVRQYTNTGLFDNVIINGRDVKLVIINQSLYIQISDATSVEYYDLMGRKVELED